MPPSAHCLPACRIVLPGHASTHMMSTLAVELHSPTSRLPACLPACLPEYRMSSLAVELHEREAHVERLSEKLEADLDLAQVRSFPHWRPTWIWPRCVMMAPPLDLAQVRDDGSPPGKAPCFLYKCCTARKGQAFIPSIAAPAPPSSLHLLRPPPPPYRELQQRPHLSTASCCVRSAAWLTGRRRSRGGRTSGWRRGSPASRCVGPL